MKGYSRLSRLPLGAVRPAGWMKEQLRRMIDGMGGHLDELEPGMIGTPYTTRESYEGWGKARRAGWGAEISGNYWWGLIELAYTSGDAAMIAKAERWVEAVLRNQREDGYLGTYTGEDDFFDDYNAWGTSCAFRRRNNPDDCSRGSGGGIRSVANPVRKVRRNSRAKPHRPCAGAHVFACHVYRYRKSVDREDRNCLYCHCNIDFLPACPAAQPVLQKVEPLMLEERKCDEK